MGPKTVSDEVDLVEIQFRHLPEEEEEVSGHGPNEPDVGGGLGVRRPRPRQPVHDNDVDDAMDDQLLLHGVEPVLPAMLHIPVGYHKGHSEKREKER